MARYLEITFTSSSDVETVELGKLLGGMLTPRCVIGLIGELGAGKTCFIKGIAEGLNGTPADEVTSPTFTILQEYPGRVPLYHFDAYRLSGPDDLEEIDFEDYIETDGVAVIEWADRIGDALPADALIIKIDALSQDRRRFNCIASESYAGLLARFRAAAQSRIGYKEGKHA